MVRNNRFQTAAGKPVTTTRPIHAVGHSLPLNIVQGDAPPAPEVLAQALVDLAAAWKQFTGSRLRRRTLILLLHDQSGVGKRDIEKVLEALDQVDGCHLKSTTSRAT